MLIRLCEALTTESNRLQELIVYILVYNIFFTKIKPSSLSLVNKLQYLANIMPSTKAQTNAFKGTFCRIRLLRLFYFFHLFWDLIASPIFRLNLSVLKVSSDLCLTRSNIISIKHLKLFAKDEQNALVLEISDVPKTMISPATCIPQKDAGNISKEKDGPNYGKELDSHHCWGSTCSMPHSRMPRNLFFFPLLKYLATQRQFLKIIFTVQKVKPKAGKQQIYNYLYVIVQICYDTV